MEKYLDNYESNIVSQANAPTPLVMVSYEGETFAKGKKTQQIHSNDMFKRIEPAKEQYDEST